MSSATVRRPEFWPVLAWAVIGAALCLAVVSILTIGIFVLVGAALGLAAVIRWRGTRDRSAVGLLCGLGVIPLYIAYLNRLGPGTKCITNATGEECTAYWHPWPFAVAGVVLIGAGVVLAVLLRRRSGTAGPAG